jgi:dTDP-4-dehydrorhamnose reductase
LIGASGQIGAHMMPLLGYSRCLATSRRPGRAGELPLDLATVATVPEAERALRHHALNAIYCIAGKTDVEGCEEAPELAYNTNCRGPQMLAHVAFRRKIPFIYFSTEYVFDGAAGPYREDDPANPLSVYGKSKLLGEMSVLSACPDALIIRTTVVYGHDVEQKNFVYSLMRSLASGKPMRVPQDQISTPTYNRDLAAATVALVERGATGIFHACGPERMDRLEFARAVASHLSLKQELLTGVPTQSLKQKAPRPLSAGLATDKLRRLHPSITMRPVAEALADCRSGLDEYIHHCATLPVDRSRKPFPLKFGPPRTHR